jgi:hypothetical protein
MKKLSFISILIFLSCLSLSTQVLAADYTLFARHSFDENYILPDTIPNQAEINAASKLTLFSARGEYEGISFAIYNNSGQELRDVNVTLSQLSKGADKITSDKIEISGVKVLQKRKRRLEKVGFEPNPEVLIPYSQGWRNAGEFNIANGKSKQWWIDIEVETNVPPGLYQGTIQIQPTNASVKSIPIELRISEAYLIAKSKQVHGFWYHPPPTQVWNYSEGDLATIGNFRKALQADLALMKKMGLQTVSGRAYSYSSSGNEYLKVFFEEAKKAGLTDTPMFLMTLGNVGDKAWMQETKRLGQSAGIPEIYWMVIDEAFQDKPDEQIPGDKAQRAALPGAYRALQTALPGDKLVMTLAFNRWFSKPGSPPYRGWQEMSDESGTPYNDYFQVQAHSASISNFGMTYPDPVGMLARHLQESGDIGYLYLNRAASVARFTIFDHRLDNGLFLGLFPVKGTYNWTYQQVIGDAYNDGDSDSRYDRGDTLYAYPDIYNQNQPLPALRFIGMREGIDDLRYVDTLKNAIAQSRANQSIKNQAQNLINEINTQMLSKVPAQDYVKAIQAVVTPEKIDGWRQQIAQLIVQLGQTTITGQPTATSTPPITCPISCQQEKPGYTGPGRDKGDANCDKVVEKNDFGIWISQYVYQPTDPLKRTADFDCTPDRPETQGVGLSDFSIWISHYAR